MEIRFAFDLVRLHLCSRIGVKALRLNRAHPFRTSIAPTENCNSRCITCNYWKVRWEDKVSRERWVEVIGQLRSVGVNRLRFTGVEPLLRRDLFEILAEIRHLQFHKVTCQEGTPAETQRPGEKVRWRHKGMGRGISSITHLEQRSPRG